MAVTLWMLATIVFLLVNVLPGDVGRKVLGPTANNVDVAAFNARLGTDKPLLEQYWRSIKQLVTFDFGDSFQTGSPVLDLLVPALGRSAKLALLAFIITIPISIAAGIYAARRQDKLADRVVVNAGLASSSLPEFVTASVLLAVFAVKWKIGSVYANVPEGTSLFGQLEYLLLPAMAMVVSYFGYIARMTRAGVITALHADYTRTATMKGLTAGQVMRHHVLRNALGAHDHRDQCADRLPVRWDHRRREGLQLRRPGHDDAQRGRQERHPRAADGGPHGRDHLHGLDPAGGSVDRRPQPASPAGAWRMNIPDPIVAQPTGPVAAVTATAAPSERKLARRENWRLIRRRPSFVIGVAIVVIWTVCALFPNLLAPFHPLDYRTTLNQSPTLKHPFGTDKGGRDVLSRVIAGARDVLKIAPLAALLGVLGGVALGMFMGYLRGWFDTIASRVVESFLSLPVVLLGLLAVTTLGNSNWVVIAVVAILFTPIVARTVRSAVLAETELDYVASAKLRGEATPFIMFREILPNVTGPIIVELTVRIGYAVFTVATLSFLGAGPPPPSPDWGSQVSDNYNSIVSGYWWSTFFPAMAIASLVIAANLIADSVQSVMEGS